MPQEILSHQEMLTKFCPIINDICKGAICVAFQPVVTQRKSIKPYNKGDWEIIPIIERTGYCGHKNISFN